MISTGSLAVGVIVLSLSTGMTSDVNNYLFGSMLAMSESDVYLSVVLGAVVLALFLIFYRRIFSSPSTKPSPAPPAATRRATTCSSRCSPP